MEMKEEWLLPTVQLKDENPKAQVWLTRKDAFTYASAIEAKLRAVNGFSCEASEKNVGAA